MTDFLHESNIFAETTGSTSPLVEPASAAKTDAGKLADHLKYVADAAVLQATNRADWLAIAALSGQNVGDASMVRKTHVQPPDVKPTDLTTWKPTDLPPLLTLPALPLGLDVDIDKIKATWQPDLDALRNSWMAQFLPAVTDVSALAKLSDNVLGGTSATAFETRLTQMESALTAAALSITTTSLQSLTTLAAAVQTALASSKTTQTQNLVVAQASYTALTGALTSALASVQSTTNANLTTAAGTVKTNIDANITTHKANIAAALALAQDNTQQIAWVRARDQVARESARLEDEAVTEFASRGFSLPAGILLSRLGQQRQATLNAAGQAAAEQALRVQQAFLEIARTTVDTWVRTMDLQTRAEVERYRAIADANLRFGALQLEADKTNADLGVRVSTLTVDAQQKMMDLDNRTAIESYRAQTDANLRFGQLQYEANRNAAEVAIKHLGLTLDITKFSAEVAVKYRLGVIEGMNGLIRAYGALRSVEVEYVRNVSAAKAQMMNALVEYYRAAISSLDVGLRVETFNKDMAMRYIGTAAQFIGTAVGNHVRAASASADAFSRIAGMALSGLNAVASQSTSG
jgi:hypothetical protein